MGVRERASHARVDGKRVRRQGVKRTVTTTMSNEGRYGKQMMGGFDQTFMGPYDPLAPFYFTPGLPDGHAETWTVALTKSGLLSNGGQLQARLLGEAIYAGKHTYKVSFTGTETIDADESMISSSFDMAPRLQGALLVNGIAYLDEDTHALVGMNLHLIEDASMNWYQVTAHREHGPEGDVVSYDTQDKASRGKLVDSAKHLNVVTVTLRPIR